MGGLVDRLKRLEDAPGGPSCTLCGQPNNPSFTTEIVSDEEDLESAYESGELCERCGRKVLYPVFWDPGRADSTLPVMLVRVRPRVQGGALE